ncbi:MAG: radical SAM protein [Deltaproteobacteria bacterium]|nr:radical SAM protein [Deltaproteobacteria bacterium]
MYEGKIYRPPSEADAFILQATIGCSWNHCTYCEMYRAKRFRVRPIEQTLSHIDQARQRFGDAVEKVFVADGDALVMDLEGWCQILDACRRAFPRLRRVSAYATALNLLAKSPAELATLRAAGLTLLYIGPETGDDATFKRIAKGANFDQHQRAAERAHQAEIALSTIFLLGAGGIERSQAHAEGSAKLITAMNPAFASALTLTVVPGTPIAKLQQSGRFQLPSVAAMLRELRTIVDQAQPKRAIFRTNHASNYLPLGGVLPDDRQRIVALIDSALDGAISLRPEWSRGL